MRDFRQTQAGRRTEENYREAFRFNGRDDEPSDGDGIEAELAAPWRRLLAFVLNMVLIFVFVVILGFLAGFLLVKFGIGYAAFRRFQDQMGGPTATGYVITLAYIALQSLLMAQTGQSFGKKIMGIRVIAEEDGGRAGFLRYVLLRETAVLLPMAVILEFVPLLGLLLILGLALAGIIMMFMPGRNRKTPQDMLARTLVVRTAPAEHRPARPTRRQR